MLQLEPQNHSGATTNRANYKRPANKTIKLAPVEGTGDAFAPFGGTTSPRHRPPGKSKTVQELILEGARRRRRQCGVQDPSPSPHIAPDRHHLVPEPKAKERKDKTRAREREREKDRNRELERDITRQRDIERELDIEREKVRAIERERERTRQRQRERDREREKECERERERDRKRELDREREREQEQRELNGTG
nr:RNA-binding protein 25-like [Drosophila bipectinata]